MTDKERLSHTLMRASIAEGNALALQKSLDEADKDVKLLEAENARLREELDRVVAML